MSVRNQVLMQVADEVVSKENIIGYLDVVKNNLTLSVLNQAMVYLQNPKAKMVCGTNEWKNVGRTVKNGAKPIVIFFPAIQMVKPAEEYEEDGRVQFIANTNVPINLKQAVYENNYVPVNVHDIDSTIADGDDAPKKEEPKFLSAISRITQGTIEFADINVSSVKGKYDKTQNVFYISNKIKTQDNDYQRAELKKAAIFMYLDYLFANDGIKDMKLKNAILYVLYEYYGSITHNIDTPLFNKLEERDIDEKIEFLSMVQYYTCKIAKDFEGHFLTFNETALVNDMLYTSNHEDMWGVFDKAIVSLDDELLIEDMQHLKSNLMRTTIECLKELVSLRNQNKLYNYPPYILELDDTDVLREETRKMVEEINDTLLDEDKERLLKEQEETPVD